MLKISDLANNSLYACELDVPQNVAIGDVVYLNDDGKLVIKNKEVKNRRCAKCGKFCFVIETANLSFSSCCHWEMTTLFKQIALGRVLSISENGKGWVRLAP